MKKREELSPSPQQFRGTMSTLARSMGRNQQSEFNARRGTEIGQKVRKQLEDSRASMRQRIGNLKGYNDLDNVLHKLLQTVELCLENEDTIKNPGFYNTLEQVQEDLTELDRFTLKFSKKAIKAFSKTGVRRKVLNIKNSLRGKNTALDILSGIGVSQPMMISQRPSPENNKEQELEINEMKGDIRQFQLMIENIQKNADKQTQELNKMKHKQEKPRLHEERPPAQEQIQQLPKKMENHEQICMEADQAYYGHGCSQNIPLAIDLYKKSAAYNNSKAMVALAKLLDKGIGVKKDPEEAYQYYKDAAQLENPEALFRLGQIYEQGNPYEEPEMVEGRPVPGIKTAIEYYQRAAEQGFSEAMTHLGLMYEKGEKVHTNLETAQELYNGAAQRNHPAGLNHLGSFIFKFKKDYKTALQYFQRAANLGCPQGKNNLGICYEFGYGVVQDLNLAFQLYKESAEAMFAPAMANLAFQYIKLGKQGDENAYTEAAEWLRSAIHRDKSLKDAYFCLASLYEKGLGTDKDSKTAFKYYKLASEGGIAKASTKCGDLLYSGVGVLRPHKTESVVYYRKGAEQGDAQALNNLALVFESGFDGNPPDYFEAARYYEKAIGRENSDAMLNYAILVQNHDVRPDLDKSKVADLLKLSARLGNKEARKLLISNQLISSMDQLSSKEPMATLQYILSAKQQYEKQHVASPPQRKKDVTVIVQEADKEANTFLSMKSLTRMMTGEEQENEQDLDLPSAPKSKVKNYEPDFSLVRGRALSKIEKRKPQLAV